MIAKIGILSDTHGLLRDEVIQALEGCDAILHGGDINRQDILDSLESIAPLYVVRGNNDKEWADHLPLFQDLHLYGLHIYMTHKKKDLPQDLKDYDLVVFGHSHRYGLKETGRTLCLNPGSCGPRRFNQEITLAVLTIDDSGSIQIRKINIPHPDGKKNDSQNSTGSDPMNAIPSSGDMKKHVSRIMKEVDKERSVPEIASKLKLDEELTEQICRLYLTHPGVTADQILAKMGM